VKSAFISVIYTGGKPLLIKTENFIYGYF